MIRSYTRRKLPHFFIYAKDKTDLQVEPINESTVNRLDYIIPSPKLNFQTQTLGKYDPKMLMRERLVPKNEITDGIISTYNLLSRSDALRIQHDDHGNPMSTYGYQKMIDALLDVCPDIDLIVDTLVKELFIRRKSKRKNIFWACFGDIVARNIRKNLGNKTGMCVKCGRRFYRESNRQVMCKECAEKAKKATNLAAQRRRREKCKYLEKARNHCGAMNTAN